MKFKTLKIEITNECNASCIFCSKSSEEEIERMSLNTIKEIIYQLPNIKKVEPQHLGEPLCHPNFIDIIRFLKKENKYIAFHTNGSLLKNDLAIDLAKLKPNLIRFSIEGDCKEIYEPLRKGLKWEEVLQNVLNFQKIKSSKTKTLVTMLITKETKPFIKRIKEFWKDKVDSFVANYEMEAGYDRVSGKLKMLPKKCWQVTGLVTIDVYGNIKICCNDWYSEFIIGHINDGIMNVLKSDKADKLRNQVLEGNMLSICKKCNVFWEAE